MQYQRRRFVILAQDKLARFALSVSNVVIRRYYEFDAWKLADAFKTQVFAIVRESPTARLDHRFRSQLIESARAPTKHIAEGYLRHSPASFITYLDYAISSLGEAEGHLRDGIELEYFSAERCVEALALAQRSIRACIALKHSQQRYVPPSTR